MNTNKYKKWKAYGKSQTTLFLSVRAQTPVGAQIEKRQKTSPLSTTILRKREDMYSLRKMKNIYDSSHVGGHASTVFIDGLPVWLFRISFHFF